jgi:hypothetical protein
MTKTTTHPENAPAGATAGRPPTPSFAARWNPRKAWRLRSRYGPVVRAVAALVGRAAGDAPRTILCVGGAPGALEAMLAASGPSGCQVRWIAASEAPPFAFDEHAFDCAVAVDWLPLVAPSRRRQAVAELCRTARHGVVLAGPFDGPETVAAERAVNDLYRAATGVDHPELGRHLEFGLPDLDATREWVAAAFAHVDTRAVEQVGLWQAAASLEVVEPATGSDGAGDDAANAAGAAAFPPLEFVYEAEPAYRTLVVASAEPASLDSQHHWSLPPERAEFTAMQMHLALEAAAQRSAFDRLAEAVTSGREREREEFRQSVASLAAELHEREAQLELLERELHERERANANQSATIALLEHRLDETDLHVENLEAEREATRVHVRNLEAEIEVGREKLKAVEAERDASRDALEARIADLERELGDTRQHERNLEDRVAKVEEDARAAQRMLAAAEAEHLQLLESRGGRALTAYIRTKRKILGK